MAESIVPDLDRLGFLHQGAGSEGGGYKSFRRQAGNRNSDREFIHKVMKMSFEDKETSAKHEVAGTCTGGVDALLSGAGYREKVGDQTRYIKNVLQTSRLPLVVEEAVDCDITNTSSIDRCGRYTLNRPMKSREILKICEPFVTSCEVTRGGAVNIPNVGGDVGDASHERN